MAKHIETKDLFGDGYHMAILCEYREIMHLIRKLINIVDSAVIKKETQNTWSYEGVCFLFAKSIISYSKMAYDNMVLGHLDAANMIIRTMIENNVCMDIILNNQKDELWKYYIVQSLKETLASAGEKLGDDENEMLLRIYKQLDVEEEFLEKSKKNNSKYPFAYINEKYGWTYKINHNFNFSGLCDLVDKQNYIDFKMMSLYSHGTSIYRKVFGYNSIDDIMNVISCFYLQVYHLGTEYCIDEVDSKFDYVAEAIESILYDYVEESPFNIRGTGQQNM